VSEDEALLKDFFNATLSIQDFNISSWNTTDGTQGLWLGLTYGSRIRNNSDSAVCRYDFNNATTDAFECIDGKWSADGLNFTADKLQDLVSF
jgi:hypothetical protein